MQYFINTSIASTVNVVAKNLVVYFYFQFVFSNLWVGNIVAAYFIYVENGIKFYIIAGKRYILIGLVYPYRFGLICL
jgi:hypothetical protein